MYQQQYVGIDWHPSIMWINGASFFFYLFLLSKSVRPGVWYLNLVSSHVMSCHYCTKRQFSQSSVYEVLANVNKRDHKLARAQPVISTLQIDGLASLSISAVDNKIKFQFPKIPTYIFTYDIKERNNRLKPRKKTPTWGSSHRAHIQRSWQPHERR